MLKNKLNVLFITVFTLFASSLCFSLPFNKNLSDDEFEKLQAGEIVIHKTPSAKNLCLKTDNKLVLKEIEEIKELNPSYIAEVIQVRPIKGNEDIIEKTRAILVDIPSYVGIPYWSVQHKRYFDLYEDGKIISHDKNGNEDKIAAMLEMPPIGQIDTDIYILSNDDFLLYKNTNSNNLYYKKIKCISKKNMRSVIIIFKDGDNFILYGVGGVEAPTLIMRKRIETSFLNRIKTFCNFVFEQL